MNLTLEAVIELAQKMESDLGIANDDLTARKYADALKVSKSTGKRKLDTLVKRGLFTTRTARDRLGHKTTIYIPVEPISQDAKTLSTGEKKRGKK